MLKDRVKIKARALGKKFDFAGKFWIHSTVSFSHCVCRIFVISEDKRFMEERMMKYITEDLSVVKTIVAAGRDVFSLPHLRLSPGVCYPPNNLQAINFVDNHGNIVTRYSSCVFQ